MQDRAHNEVLHDNHQAAGNHHPTQVGGSGWGGLVKLIGRSPTLGALQTLAGQGTRQKQRMREQDARTNKSTTHTRSALKTHSHKRARAQNTSSKGEGGKWKRELGKSSVRSHAGSCAQ